MIDNPTRLEKFKPIDELHVKEPSLYLYNWKLYKKMKHLLDKKIHFLKITNKLNEFIYMTLSCMLLT